MAAAFHFCELKNMGFEESNQEYWNNMIYGPDPSLGRTNNCLILEMTPTGELIDEWKLYTPCGVWRFKGLNEYGITGIDRPWFQRPSQVSFEEKRNSSLHNLHLKKLNDRFFLIQSIRHMEYLGDWGDLPSVEPRLDRCLILTQPTNSEKEEIELHLNLTIETLFATRFNSFEMRRILLCGDRWEKWFDPGKYVDKPIHRSIFIQYYEHLRDD